MTTTAIETPAGALAPPAAAEPAADRIQRAFEAEELRGLRVGTWVRFAVILAIALWLPFLTPTQALWYYYLLMVGFVALAVAHYEVRRRALDAAWAPYLFVLLDNALLAFTLIVPNPHARGILPAGAQLHFGNELYFFIFICAAVFSYSPRVVVWAGVSAALAYGTGVWWLTLQPGSYAELANMTFTISPDRLIAHLQDFNRIDVSTAIQAGLLYITVACVLAAGVWRVRALVRRNAVAERARANLSRYFSPNIVEELANADAPLSAGRRQDVAVLFADVVGFTKLAEGLAPDRVLALLREVHRLLAREVFAHGGTLDKYLGDGVLATFGTPVAGPRDAANALGCARAILAALPEWNGARVRAGQAPIRIGVGVHYGPVVLGDVGGAQQLEYTVIGDTVNVASRIERLTRELACDLIASDALVVALSAPDRALARDLVKAPSQTLRGRSEPIALWTYRA